MTPAEMFAAAYDGTDGPTRAAGAAWYPDVLRWARSTARAYGSTIHQVAGAVAALSPRCRFDLAQRGVESMLGGGSSFYGLPVQRTKAEAILRGDTRPVDGVTGPKCSAFFRNIMGDPDAVTLDVHMLRVIGLAGVTPKGYEPIADALREAARAHGVPPRDLQATVWIGERGKP